MLTICSVSINSRRKTDKKVIEGLMEKIGQPVNKKIYRRCTVSTIVLAGDINIYDRIRCS